MMSNSSDGVTKELGEKIRKARERAKMTQADVAAAVDVHVNYYARIERGEVHPSFERLQKIMKALNIRTLNITSQ